jgi:pimeloyl-ACP methyl ester carboxylesterase
MYGEDLEMGNSLLLQVLRGGFRVLGRAAPGPAAAIAGRLFGTPPRHRTTQAERRALARGRPGRVTVDGSRVAMWTWGEGPVVLLAHGWGSRGARLHSFIEPLVASGRTVVAFDAPGHGDSSGRTSSLPQFALAIRAVAEAAGGFEAAVAHSLGCPAVAFAMTRGLALARAVFLAPAANPGAYTERFARKLALPDHVLETMKRRFEERYGLRWEELDLPRAAPRLGARLLVVHDRDDAEVPWSNGEAVAAAWPEARLVTTEGLGHKRLVHDPAVVAEAVAFLCAATAGRRPL